MSLTLPVEDVYTKAPTISTVGGGIQIDTASWTPITGRLYCFAVLIGVPISSTVPLGGTLSFTGTGFGSTIYKVGETGTFDGGTKRVCIYAGLTSGTPTAGVLRLLNPLTPATTYAILGGYRWIGPTALANIVGSPVLNNLNNSAGPLAITMPAPSGPTNGVFMVAGIKGQATAASPGTGMTELRDDGIDNTKRLWVGASTAPVATPSLTVTGDPDGVYTGQNLYGIAIEIADILAGYTVDGRIIYDYVPPALSTVLREYEVVDGIWVPVRDGLALTS